MAFSLKQTPAYQWLSGWHRWPMDSYRIFVQQTNSGECQLPSVPGGFLADPFMAQVRDSWWIFAEMFRFSRNKGHIVAAPFDLEKGTLIRPFSSILEMPEHLSYPCVVKDQDCVFMIPESNQRLEAAVWKCIEFPHRWVQVGCIARGNAFIDTSLHWHEGRWYAWTMAPVQGVRRQLLFSSPRLDAEAWEPHPTNEKTYPGMYLRNAGRIFKGSDGGLYRPYQKNSRYYGDGVDVHAIVRLDPERYEETPANIRTAVPLLPAHAHPHHIDVRDNLVVWDERTRIAYSDTIRHLLLPRKWKNRRFVL